MLPGDRLVCGFVQPQEAGTTFRDWLLHVTIVPWFRLDEDSDRIAAGLEEACAAVRPFEARPGEMVRFGPKKNRPARLVELPTPFTDIEQKVRGYLHKKRAWLVDETTKQRHEFRPHVTVQKGDGLDEGKTFLVERLYIVEQKGDYKEITAEIPLG